MKNSFRLLALVALMATIFLTSCYKEEENEFAPQTPTGLYIYTFVRDYQFPDTEVVKSATIADTTEYLFEITSLGAKILNDNSVTVSDFEFKVGKVNFTLSDGSKVTAYPLPFTKYGKSKDFPFNGIIHAYNFIFAISGENNIKILDLETGDLIFSGKGMILDDELVMNMGVLIPSLKFVGTNPNGIGNTFQFTWITRTYPGYSLTTQN
jgi:hypothetical protein